MKMDPDYGHQINPVSRLMQVMQARKDTEPKFQLIAEHGQSRYKEFVVEVTCGEELRCEGTGPNKKLAKRAAAEAMLARIGYVKPMPKPGKSLLKKRNDACRIVDSEQPKPLEIGVFNADELITSSQTNSMTTSVNESDDSNARNDSENSPKESVSEVTLSVTATIGSQVMTFADVDQTARADDHHTVWGSAAAAAESTSFPDAESRNVTNECENDDTNKSSTKPTTPANKRHVTFSNEVSACPPPDDSNYPSALITPLKSEMLFVSKMRKRGRDSKKLLSDEQKREMAEMAREFLAGWNAAENASLVKAYAENAPKSK
ncbi:unnamed protein product [Anisakis simplex]|uniref:Maternal effect protein staufen (inferred by orthology to a D. melanogaster protein) n=1 Tax=Anisakis simplex TaxID=6269 RepID=A0A0M3KDL9_ANISI|nr:unnamed protein product [Anisakis simplex]